MSVVTKKEQQERLRRNEQKWTRALMDAGWTVLPSVILERQKALGLDATDVNILLHLARHWWHADNPPHPSKALIAECMQIDISTVRRRIARLERDGLIRREARFNPESGRQQTNFYHFAGLIQNATPYAEELIQERRQRRREDAERSSRKRPKLTLVAGSSSEEP